MALKLSQFNCLVSITMVVDAPKIEASIVKYMYDVYIT